MVQALVMFLQAIGHVRSVALFDTTSKIALNISKIAPELGAVRLEAILMAGAASLPIICTN